MESVVKASLVSSSVSFVGAMFIFFIVKAAMVILGPRDSQTIGAHCAVLASMIALASVWGHYHLHLLNITV